MELVNNNANGMERRIAQQPAPHKEQKMVALSEEELSKLLADSARRGYKQARKEVSIIEDEDLVCIFPEAMKKRAMRGEFITMLEIYKCKIAYRKGHKKKSVGAKLNKILNDEDEEEADNYSGQLTWSQYKSLIPDLIYLYVVVGKHYKKTQMVLIYCRNLIHFGDFRCFTYDSIMTGDHEIRARHQGLDFVWRIDSNAKHAWFLPYTQSVPTVRNKDNRSRVSSSSSAKGARGPCYKWLQGEKCEPKDCRWTHRCSACRGKEHVMAKCEKSTMYMSKIKALKTTMVKA